MEPATLAGLILVAGIVVFLLMGAPISVGVGLSATLAMFVILGVENGVLTSAQQVFRGINSFPLLAIPFFVLAGVIMNNGGIALLLINAAKVMVGKIPGSLAQTNVAANALFGAVSGSAVAAAAAIGSTMGPLEAKDKYDKNFAAAVNIASAPSGMLIPPSNLMIVYSLVSSTSIAAMFVAGYIPGLMWAAACMVIVYLYARNRPELKLTEKVSFGQGALVIFKATPALLLIVVVIGGILAGTFTPTEGSCIAVVYSLVLSFIYRSIKVKQLPGMLLDATRTTAVVMFLIGVSSIMGFVLSFAEIPAQVSNAMFSISDNPVILLLLIAVVLLIVGCFMDPTPAVLIFTPIFLPIAQQFGIDLINFGVVMTLLIMVGNLTPPVGMCLFAVSSFSKVSIGTLSREVLPYLVGIFLVTVLIAYVPQISTFLPNLIMGR